MYCTVDYDVIGRKDRDGFKLKRHTSPGVGAQFDDLESALEAFQDSDSDIVVMVENPHSMPCVQNGEKPEALLIFITGNRVDCYVGLESYATDEERSCGPSRK